MANRASGTNGLRVSRDKIAIIVSPFHGKICQHLKIWKHGELSINQTRH